MGVWALIAVIAILVGAVIVLGEGGRDERKD